MGSWIEKTERQIMAEEAAKAQRETEIKLATLASRAVVTDRILAVNAEVERTRLQREQEILTELERLSTLHDIHGMVTDIRDRFFPDARVVDHQVNPEWRIKTDENKGPNPSIDSMIIRAAQSIRTVEEEERYTPTGSRQTPMGYTSTGSRRVPPSKYFETRYDFKTCLGAGIAYRYFDNNGLPNEGTIDTTDKLGRFMFYVGSGQFNNDIQFYRSYPKRINRFDILKQEGGGKIFGPGGKEISSIPSLSDALRDYIPPPLEYYDHFFDLTDKLSFQKQLLNTAMQTRTRMRDDV